VRADNLVAQSAFIKAGFTEDEHGTCCPDKHCRFSLSLGS
jgi:hypothetical protein